MEQIHITDVAPRDGLQNQQEPVDTQAKLQLIRLLVAAGVRCRIRIQAAKISGVNLILLLKAQ